MRWAKHVAPVGEREFRSVFCFRRSEGEDNIKSHLQEIIIGSIDSTDLVQYSYSLRAFVDAVVILQCP